MEGSSIPAAVRNMRAGGTAMRQARGPDSEGGHCLGSLRIASRDISQMGRMCRERMMYMAVLQWSKTANIFMQKSRFVNLACIKWITYLFWTNHYRDLQHRTVWLDHS